MENILERINKAGLEFLTPLTLQQTYSKITEEAAKLVNSPLAALFLFKDKKLFRAATFPETEEKISEPRKRGYTVRAFTEKRAFIVPAAELNRAHPELKSKEYKVAIFIPLIDNRKCIGTLELLSSSEERFSGSQLKTLKAFGAYACLAIRKARLFEEIKEALETRDLFISMAAHELRTPITTISGYVQLLRGRLAKIGATEARWVEELAWEVARLTSLVNELLEVGRINTGKVQYVWRENSLKTIIERAIRDFRFAYPQHKVVFQDHLKDIKGVVVSDFDKLLQVIINLLENGGKFSPPGSEIVIDLKFHPPCLILTIRDHGRGIAKKDLPRVFEGFYRGKDVAREGMGLGLYLAKNIIEEHRGSIHIHSKPNKGTLVEVQLPQAKYSRVTP